MNIWLNGWIRAALCSIGGMTLTGENQITQSKTCPTASLPTINLTWTVPEHNPGLHSQKPTTNLLSHARPIPWLPFRCPKTVSLSGYSWKPNLVYQVYSFLFWCCEMPLLHNQTTTPWFFRTAPPYFYIAVHACIDVVFPGKWIGNARHIPWPPSSPDMHFQILKSGY